MLLEQRRESTLSGARVICQVFLNFQWENGNLAQVVWNLRVLYPCSREFFWQNFQVQSIFHPTFLQLSVSKLRIITSLPGLTKKLFASSSIFLEDVICQTKLINFTPCNPILRSSTENDLAFDLKVSLKTEERSSFELLRITIMVLAELVSFS